MRLCNWLQYSLRLALLTGLFVAVPAAIAQQATEQFIPIGKSPGVSDRYSYIGTVLAVDATSNSITIESNRGNKTIKVTPRTRIWLDRSKQQQTNIPVSFAEIEVGRRLEVMHEPVLDTLADWIKIEAD